MCVCVFVELYKNIYMLARMKTVWDKSLHKWQTKVCVYLIFILFFFSLSHTEAHWKDWAPILQTRYDMPDRNVFDSFTKQNLIYLHLNNSALNSTVCSLGWTHFHLNVWFCHSIFSTLGILIWFLFFITVCVLHRNLK